MKDDIFKITIPLTEQVKRRRINKAFCRIPRSRSAAEIMNHLGLKHRGYFRSAVLQPLLVEGVPAAIMPDTP